MIPRGISSCLMKSLMLLFIIAVLAGCDSGKTIEPDANEPNNEIANSTHIVVGTVYSNSLDTETDIDYFRVTLGKDLTYKIESLNMNQELILYDRNEDELATSEGIIVYTASVTDYHYIKVSNTANTGNYELLISMVDNYEPDGDFDSATNLSVNEIQFHSIDSDRDYDYFSIELTAGETYNLGTNSSELQNTLVLYDSAFTEVETGVGSILYNCIVSGSYFVRISNSTATGNYQFYVSTGDQYESNDSFENSSAISAGDPLQAHTFHVFDDVDYLKVYLEAGTEYKIETYESDTGSDTVLSFYDSGFNLLAENDDYTGVYSRIDYTCSVSGDYFIKVSELGGDTGGYSIDVQVK